MSNLYDLFGQEETEQKPRNNQKWQAEQKANREYCYAQIEKSLETVGKSPELFQGYLNVQANLNTTLSVTRCSYRHSGKPPPKLQTTRHGKSRVSL